MQEGSVIIMEKAMEPELWEAMRAYMIKPPPIPSKTQYMVTGFCKEEQAKELGFKTGIYLDAYPEYEAKEVPLNADLFVELLPPQDLTELIHYEEPKVHLLPV